MVTSHAAALIVPFKCSRNTNIFLVFRSAHFYNFVKSMLVRNPKKRPSASKMLSVSCFHYFYRVFRLMCVKIIKDSSFNSFCMSSAARVSHAAVPEQGADPGSTGEIS